MDQLCDLNMIVPTNVLYECTYECTLKMIVTICRKLNVESSAERKFLHLYDPTLALYQG